MDAQPRRGPVAALAGVVLCLSCATLRSWFLEEPFQPAAAPDAALPEYVPDAGHAVAPVWLPGPLLRAASVAARYEASQYQRQHEEQIPEFERWLRCMSRPDSYDVQVISEDSERWLVFVVPVQQRCEDAGWGGRLITGGTTFEISKTDFRIISAQQWEG